MKSYNLLTTRQLRGRFIGRTIRVNAFSKEEALYRYMSELSEIDVITLKAVRVLNGN